MKRRTVLNEGFFVHLQFLLDLLGVLGQIDILGMRSDIRFDSRRSRSYLSERFLHELILQILFDVR